MRIGVEGLSAAEANLLRTILKLSTQLQANWVLSEEGPCDVLLTPLAAQPERAPGLKAQIIVPIVRRGERATGECLERPFRAEEFVALLGRVGPLVRPDVGLERQIEAVPPSSGRRGRLKRWPPSHLMGSSRERIQLATLLSRQSRSARELSSVAGYSESNCSAFMLELEKHDLLNWETPERPEQLAPALPASVSQRMEAPGLLSSIRRRLGLSWNSRSAG